MTDTNTAGAGSETRPQAPVRGAGPVVPAAAAGRVSSYLSAEQSLPTSTDDPIEKYIKIISNKDLDSEEKRWLVDQAKIRFKNRRRMAYIALATIIGSLLVVLVGAVVDGVAGTNIVGKLNETANLLGGINALLTGIVAAYYGASTIRPSS